MFIYSFASFQNQAAIYVHHYEGLLVGNIKYKSMWGLRGVQWIKELIVASRVQEMLFGLPKQHSDWERP